MTRPDGATGKLVRNGSAISDLEARAGALVASRYGVSSASIERALSVPPDGRERSNAIEVLDVLVKADLITAAQAQDIRRELQALEPESTVVGTFPFGAAVPDGPLPEVRKADKSNGASDSPVPMRKLGEFRLLRRLGEGGMGAVYLGYQEGLNRQVAIKVLADSLSRDRGYLRRFQREARSGLVLNHPNIVRCFGAGQDPQTGRYFLVLEYVDGPTGRALLEQFGRMSVGDAVHIALDLARGLEHIHGRNYVHRDIKPDNVFVTRSGLAKLGDLGLAKKVDDTSHLTAARQGVGTPFYMPYEQIISARHVDGRSDIYALGATLYHLLTGEVPFPGQTALETAERKILGTFLPASSLNASVPPALDEVLEKMMALRPTDRYQTTSELIVALERTGLSAVVPTFVDAEAALRDPHVRARLAPAQATKADLTIRVEAVAKPTPPAGGWVLRYRDGDGQIQIRAASTAQLLRDWRAGRLPEDAEIRRRNQTEFKPLTAYRAFGHELPQATAQRSNAPSPTPVIESVREAPASSNALPRPPLWRRPAVIAASVGAILLIAAWAILWLLTR